MYVKVTVSRYVIGHAQRGMHALALAPTMPWKT